MVRVGSRGKALGSSLIRTFRQLLCNERTTSFYQGKEAFYGRAGFPFWPNSGCYATLLITYVVYLEVEPFSHLLTSSRIEKHPMIIFPDLPDIEVQGVEVAEEITLTLRTTSPTASCPSCGTVSSRIQSRYIRTLHDLPTVGRPIHLILHVRRFFC
jgi:hypothetical protein